MSKHAEVTHNNKRYIELGYNISYYRKHKGYTQEQLAEKLDISRQHLGAVKPQHRPIHFAGSAV